jgi:predicted ribosomally synthesized peptide with SipW-like signal peptide
MKKKIFVIAVAACILVLSIASSTIAYFTDTEKYTNVFTAGNVAITLTAGNQTVDGSTLELTDKMIFPGQTIEKNVTITNTGTENAYVAAVITLSDTSGNLLSVVNADGSANNVPVAIATFLTKLGEDGYTKNVVVDNGTIVIYLVKNAALTANSGTTEVFENIVIPTSWNNAEITAFADTTIDVKAYATQTKGTGFGDAVSAVKTAFPDVFGSINFS